MDQIQQKRPRGRPPKSQQKSLDTKSALIRSGIETLTQRGYMTADIDSILKKVGVPKGSFYYYFDSKEAFGREVMASYARYFAHKLDLCLHDASLSPLNRLYAFYQNAKAGMAKYQFERGCLIGNLGQEVTVLPDSYRTLLNEILKDWQDRVEACLQEAQSAGEISSEANCQQLAYFFWIGWEGAVMRAKLIKSDQPLTIFIDGFIDGLPR
jgi:TetR/AcrR family transcriptional repressor of nem operon